MIGQTISHYNILERLGGGGMGIVYKAEDTRLKRAVALKFLPTALTHDEDFKVRFVREAQAASALDHPNICTVHEIDETDDGQMFICMTFYNGETVKKKIARGPMEVKEVVDIATGVAQGLAKAHSNGMVHRDIKPANIMVTDDGEVKIVDFGLAQLAGLTKITKVGKMVGTIAYMSPEQLTGEEVDNRTDIWSLGVVIYEMVSGRLPFRADHQHAMMYSILHDAPRPVSSLRSDISDSLERVVGKAMEKNRNHRYQNVQTLGEDLSVSSVQRPVIIEREKSIVVLPFEDISPGKDNEYFSDGLTDEIIADLSQIHSLRVISRTSAMRLKNTKKDARAIGRDLNVEYLLEGSVRKLGSSLRITAQLIDVRNDSHIWAEKYNGTLEDVFEMQERVSRSIVDTLKLKLSPEENQYIARHPIQNVHAYESYLRARQEVMLFTEEGLNRALQHLQRALDIVGENALLYAGIGYVYWSLVNLGIKEPEEYLGKVEKYAAKVFELDPDSSRGHMLLGVVDLTRGNAQDAVRHLKQTLITGPDDPDALFWLLVACGNAGKTSISKRFAERLLEVDPLTPINHGTPAYGLLCEGRFDLALEVEQRWYEMEPNTAISKFWYGWVLAQNSRRTKAISLFDEAAKDAPDDLWANLGLCFKYAFRGDVDALNSVTAGLARIARWDAQYSWFLAECYALIGDKVRALDWLENAADRGFINYPLIRKLDPFLDNARNDQEFEELVERIRREWEDFEV